MNGHPAAPTPRDASALRTLATWSTIHAALLIPGGLALATAAVAFGYVTTLPEATKDPDVASLGLLGAVMFGGLALVVWAASIALFRSAANMKRRRRRTFSWALGFALCIPVPLPLLSFPAGIVLGIFTMIVLSRPSIRALYAGEQDVGRPVRTDGAGAST